jgi:hypothetical protein
MIVSGVNARAGQERSAGGRFAEGDRATQALRWGRVLPLLLLTYEPMHIWKEPTAMTDEEPKDEKPKEPAWLRQLASVGASAKARQERDAKNRGSHGAASAGRSVASWACKCGWSGVSKDLKPDPVTFVLNCPRCGKSDGLKAA